MYPSASPNSAKQSMYPSASPFSILKDSEDTSALSSLFTIIFFFLPFGSKIFTTKGGMASDGAPGVDYGSLSFDDKMRIYYSMRPYLTFPLPSSFVAALLLHSLVPPHSFIRRARIRHTRMPESLFLPKACSPLLIMRVATGKLFPYAPMHQWLSYGGSDKAGDSFSKREFSFTLKDDIYIRSAS